MEDDIAPQNMHEIRDPFLIRNPWFSIFLVMLYYLLFQLIPQLVYTFFVDESFLIAYPFIIRIIEFFSLGIMLLLFIPIFRIPSNNKTYKQYMRDIQLSQTTKKGVLVGLLIILVVFVLAYGSVYLSAVLSKLYLVNIKGYIVTVTPQVFWNPSYLLNPHANMNVYYALTPGIWEEVAFRGLILVLLFRKYSMKTAMIVDGIIFGLFHLLNLLGPTINFLSGAEGWTKQAYLVTVLGVGFQVIYAGSLGITWAFLFVKTKSLWPSILGHYLIDAFGGLVLYPNILIIYSNVELLWIYYSCITLLGIGILPAIMDILIIKGLYRNEPIQWAQNR